MQIECMWIRKNIFECPLLYDTNGIHAHSSVKAKEKIIYTLTDEAPLLASYSLLPIITTMCAKAGIPVESGFSLSFPLPYSNLTITSNVITVDIGLASRIIAAWPKYLSYDQRMVCYPPLSSLDPIAHSTLTPTSNTFAQTSRRMV